MAILPGAAAPYRPIVLLLAVFGLAGLSRAADANIMSSAAVYEKTVSPLLEKYCYDCHGNGKHKGDVALDKYQTLAAIDQDRTTWETVLHHVGTSEMPPDDADLQPTAAEREVITTWIEKELYSYDPKHPDPGRVTIHRLNREEYNNTIRDLVGVDFQPAEDFPSDNSGYGFDNISDVLSLPPVLMEKYLSAADRILNEAIATEAPPSRVKRMPANLMEMGFNADGDRGDGWMPLGGLEEDELATTMPFAAGDYIVRVLAFNNVRQGPAGSAKAAPAPKDPIKLTCMVDTSVVNIWGITAIEAKPDIYEARIGIPAGKHRIAVVNHRIRGGANELQMANGRIGAQQRGNIMVKWVEIEGPLQSSTRRFPAAKLEAAGEVKNTPDGARLLEHNGEVGVKLTVAKDADYILRAQVYAHQAGKDPARMEFRVNGQGVKTFDVLAPATMKALPDQRVFSTVLLEAQPQVYEFHTQLKAGENRFAAAFINDFADPENKNPNLRARNLVIDHLEVVGLAEPQLLPPMPEQIQQLFTHAALQVKPTGLLGVLGLKKPRAPTDQEMAREILVEFTHRAWRRPVQPSEVTELMSFFDMAEKDGQKFNASVKLAMKAVLVSPDFLFRGEIEPDPNNPSSVHPVSEFALASRLSYFLWSSTPDDELLDLAGRGQLRQNLEPEVRRMLASPKAEAFVDNFSGQWLETRNLKFIAPDKELFPDFDENLRKSMGRETQLFFGSVMHEDRSVLDFLTADYTFVNERLARHYGIANVKGDEFQRVSLVGTPRRGVLTQASVLALTSNPTRTSPVKRGKWVLENLLGTPPPAPPPNVPPLPGDSKAVLGTMRQQMEEHRANPVCASCHARMDPIGFGLDNFDAIGEWRAKDGGLPIDPAGNLTTGESFQGANELTNILVTKKRDYFLRCLSEKMLTYALGRGIEYYDRPATDQIMSGLEKNQYKFSSLVLGVVKSLPFQEERGEGPRVSSN